MERFVLTDAQWAKHGAGIVWVSLRTPGAAEATTRRFVEAVLRIVRTEARGASFSPFFGNWSTASKRYRDWVKARVFTRLFEACSTRRTWMTPWSTPPSSRSIAMDKAQKGVSGPGHRPVQRRHDDQNPGADRRTRLPRALRPKPGHRFDTVGGVAPLIDGLAFEGFIADKASSDSNSIIADLNERGAKIVISQHPRRALAFCRSTRKSTSGVT